MKYRVEVLNREAFVAARYKRFLDKIKFFGGKPTAGSTFHFTDLDKDYGDGVMKDIVVCDMCNENIKDPEFILLEKSRVYHFACCEYRPAEPKAKPTIVVPSRTPGKPGLRLVWSAPNEFSGGDEDEE